LDWAATGRKGWAKSLFFTNRNRVGWWLFQGPAGSDSVDRDGTLDQVTTRSIVLANRSWLGWPIDSHEFYPLLYFLYLCPLCSTIHFTL